MTDERKRELLGLLETCAFSYACPELEQRTGDLDEHERAYLADLVRADLRYEPDNEMPT